MQAFHESTAQRGGHLDKILRDVCAMANTNGGTIYIGVSATPKENPVGVREPKKVIERLYSTIGNRFSPEPNVHIDSLSSQGKTIVRVTVQPGSKIPYAIDNMNFYVRDESETNLAVRDEIVRMVELGLTRQGLEQASAPPPVSAPLSEQPSTLEAVHGRQKPKSEPPRTGVEVVNSEKRQGTIYHTVRDLRNGNLIHNVTKSSARKLWHYAISQAEEGPIDQRKVQWHNNMAVLKQRTKGDNIWYDLALREGKQIHVYYGVTDSGLNDEWLALVGENS